jgi:flavin-binding protein dodecin
LTTKFDENLADVHEDSFSGGHRNSESTGQQLGKQVNSALWAPVAMTYNSPGLNQRRGMMPQKIIDVVGTSKESFAKAAENAVAEAAKTVRGMKWARVAELEMELDGKKITQYRTTARIYFDVEH